MVAKIRILEKLNNKIALLFTWRGNLSCKHFINAGFSLAEVLIAMLIMSVFYVATTKVMTTKQKPQIQEYPHGYYECYDNGGLTEHRVDLGRTSIQPRLVTDCNFNAPTGLPVFNIYIAIPGVGLYSTPEAQVNDDDNMVFANPRALVDIYAEAVPDIMQIMNENKQEKFAQFRTYLMNSHPQSVLAQNWAAENPEPPYPVVFVVW